MPMSEGVPSSPCGDKADWLVTMSYGDKLSGCSFLRTGGILNGGGLEATRQSESSPGIALKSGFRRPARPPITHVVSPTSRVLDIKCGIRKSRTNPCSKGSGAYAGLPGAPASSAARLSWVSA